MQNLHNIYLVHVKNHKYPKENEFMIGSPVCSAIWMFRILYREILCNHFYMLQLIQDLVLFFMQDI